MKLKNKRHILYFVLFIGTILFTMESCKKYTEDSPFTIKSPKNRLVGVWKSESIKENNVEPFDIAKTKMEFKRNGDFKIFFISDIYSNNTDTINAEGKWEFDKEKENILVNYLINYEDTLQFYSYNNFSVYTYLAFGNLYLKETQEREYKILYLTDDNFSFEQTYIEGIAIDTIVYNHEMVKDYEFKFF